ncbi:CidA/LrgA family protein [Bdellovibrio bacteriovorus]|uniref:CidA/LrgA family protein n=1 Tax=Bdellovibrio bacteriovorus TaxID=959 RepID=UPI0035A60DD9
MALLNLFIPGPVLGMVYFFIALVLWPALKEKVEALSRFMNAHLALFFVPAGVGIIDYFDLFGRYGWAMGITLIISTLITLAVTAWFFNFFLKMNPEEPKS